MLGSAACDEEVFVHLHEGTEEAGVYLASEFGGEGPGNRPLLSGCCTEVKSLVPYSPKVRSSWV